MKGCRDCGGQRLGQNGLDADIWPAPPTCTMHHTGCRRTTAGVMHPWPLAHCSERHTASQHVQPSRISQAYLPAHPGLLQGVEIIPWQAPGCPPRPMHKVVLVPCTPRAHMSRTDLIA